MTGSPLDAALAARDRMPRGQLEATPLATNRAVKAIVEAVSAALLDPIAEWIVETLGYPIDMTLAAEDGTPLPPAEPLRRAIEEAWVRHDGPDDADAIRRNVADEGGWA